MNERIKELLEQADNIEILPDEEFCDTDFLADIDPRRVKKFAELIVRECAEHIRNRAMRAGGACTIVGEESLWLAKDLEEHFGVEE